MLIRQGHKGVSNGPTSWLAADRACHIYLKEHWAHEAVEGGSIPHDLYKGKLENQLLISWCCQPVSPSSSAAFPSYALDTEHKSLRLKLWGCAGDWHQDN